MDDSLISASEKLIHALQNFSNAIKGGKGMKEQPDHPRDYDPNNVHYLLRIVWIYVKNSTWKEQDLKQGDLPPDFKFDEEKFQGDALDALEKLYRVLGEPWKGYSNPCEGAWPRRIRGY